jgi:WD40 repeat protein
LELHHGPLSVASLDAERKRLVVGCSDGSAAIWQLEGEHFVTPLVNYHHMPLTAVAFSPDGKSILPPSLDGTANLWNATSGSHRLALPAAADSSGVIAAAFHPRGDRLLTATSTGTVKVFAVADGHATVSLAIAGHLDAARFTGDGVGIVTMEDGGAVQIWDVTTGAPLTRFTKHEAAVLGAVFSPSADVMVTFSRDGVARVWNLRAARLPRVLPLAAPLTTLAVSPDGQQIFTASEDNLGQLWNADGSRSVKACSHGSQWIQHATFSADSRRLLTVSRDAVHLWNCADGQRIELPGGARIEPEEEIDGKHLTNDTRFVGATFADDGRTAISISRNGVWMRWEIASGRKLGGTALGMDVDGIDVPSNDRLFLAFGQRGAQLESLRTKEFYRSLGGGDVTSARFSSDSKRVAIARSDGTLTIYNLDGWEITAFRLRRPIRINAVTFSADNARILFGSADGSVTLGDPRTGELLTALVGHHAGISCCAIHANGRFAATGDVSGEIRFWDLTTGRELLALHGHRTTIHSLGFVSGGDFLVSGAEDDSPRLWDLRPSPSGAPAETIARINSEVPYHMESNRLLPESLSAANLSYDSFGRQVAPDKTVGTPAVRDIDGLGKLAERARRNLIANSAAPSGLSALAARSLSNFVPAERDLLSQTLANYAGVIVEPAWHTERIVEVTASPDGQGFATASWDGLACVGDAATGELVSTFRGHTDRVYHARFLPDGKRLLTSSRDDTVRIWDIASGRELLRIPLAPAREADIKAGRLKEDSRARDGVWDAIFTLDGKRIISGGLDGSLRVWDANDGRLLVTLALFDRGIERIAISPTGDLVAAGDDSGVIRLWESRTYAERLTSQGEKALVKDLCFSPDGSLLAAAAGKSMIVSRTTDGAKVADWTLSDEGDVESVDFSPDGTGCWSPPCERRCCSIGQGLLPLCDRPGN